MNKIINNSAGQKMVKCLKALAGTLLLVLMAACASNVTVVADIPTPLVAKVPLNAYLSYTEEFKNHVYIESEKKRVLRSIDFANAQAELFDSVFGQLTTLVSLDDVSKDLIIEPEILDFQYTAPHETKLKQYEVWIKYRLKILKPDSSNLADWTIKGYGKTPTAMLTSASRAFNSATNIALRDVGAQLSTRFSGQRSVKKLIANKVDPQQVDSVELVDDVEKVDAVELVDSAVDDSPLSEPEPDVIVAEGVADNEGEPNTEVNDE